MVTVKILIIALLAVGGIYAYANYDPETFNGIINNIPGISTSESKLKDCSIYREQYSKDFSDNPDNMITGALDGVAKTRACEKYNEGIKRQYGELGIDTTKMVCPDGDGYSICELNKKYPTGGPAIRAAVDAGQLDYNKLPKEYQQKYNDTPAPYILGHKPKEIEKKPTDAMKAEDIAKQAEETAQRDVQEEIKYTSNTPPRQCADLTQKDLRACDLRPYIALRDRDFSYANLYWAILSDMDLSRSNFTGANLHNTYLGNSNITGAIFTGCRGIPQNTPIICTPNMGGWK